MSIEDQAPPPSPLPPAAQSPYPAQPAPKPHVDIPVAKTPETVPSGPGLGALGITLLGGAVAGAIGLLIAGPVLRRKRAPAHAKARRTTKKKD